MPRHTVRLEDARRDEWVSLHLVPLITGEGRFLMQHAIVHPGLAEIMYQPSQRKIARGPPAPSYVACQTVGVDCDAAAMLVGQLVSLADAVRQLIDRMLCVAASPRDHFAHRYSCSIAHWMSTSTLYVKL
jgi:hypothetical protein